MDKKLVVWTTTAVNQRRAIFKYWIQRNKSAQYPKKLIGLISKKIKLIEKNPLAGKPTNFIDTRVTALGNYSIYYRVINDQIFITAFWDNRQDPEQLINNTNQKI